MSQNSDEKGLNAAALQRLLDESDLQKLIMQLPWNLDQRDWDAIGRLFTEDAEFEIKGEKRKGREAIVNGPKGDLEKLYEATYHHVGNIYIDIDGDTAGIIAYTVAYHLPKGSDLTTHADVGGKYHVEAVRTETGWLIRRIRLELHWMGGIPFMR